MICRKFGLFKRKDAARRKIAWNPTFQQQLRLQSHTLLMRVGFIKKSRTKCLLRRFDYRLKVGLRPLGYEVIKTAHQIRHVDDVNAEDEKR